MRGWLAILAIGFAPLVCAAQEVRLDVSNSRIVDNAQGIAATIYLSAVVPYRVFTLDAPARLVIDFQGVDAGQVSASDLVASENVAGSRVTPTGDGWTRLIVDLTVPLSVQEVEMRRRAADGTATLRVSLVDRGAEAFTQSAGAPPGIIVVDPGVVTTLHDTPSDLFVIAIDPGHGGIDPGAQRAGVAEAELVLTFAQELARALADITGVAPVLTRNDDTFVSLHQRISRARDAGADVMISLHADALAEDSASGLSVYTLGAAASQTASQRMAERHERGDLLAGVDLTDQDDQIATVLMDLARRETAPEAVRLADMIVRVARDNDVDLNSRPRREASFVVLSAADFPSVLIELGFLSNEGDRRSLLDPSARAQTIGAMVAALMQWRDTGFPGHPSRAD